MTNFVRVGTVAELEPNGQFSRWVQNHDVLVYKFEGKIQAISNICRHFGGPIGFHKAKNGKFTCLWHNYEFEAKNGNCLTNPSLSARQYDVRVEGQDILVQLAEVSAETPRGRFEEATPCH